MTIPSAPSSLTATTISDVQINLAWTDNSGDETGFKIEESPNVSGNWTEISTVVADVVGLNRVGRTPGTRYFYRVRAYNGDGNSAYSNVASAITTGWSQVVYDIGAQVYFDWDRDGTYTSEDDYLVSVRGAHRLSPPGQSITTTSGRVAECTVVLDNSTGRFSSHNTGGALYAYIGSGKAYHVPVKVQISSVDAGDSASYQSVFVGVARIPVEATLSPGQPKTITFDCRGVEEILLNRRQRTTRADFATYADDGVTESEFMDEVLTDSGATLTTVLDDGLFAIPWAWLDNESIVEELWKLAAACGGRFYGDAGGQLVYESATHWLMSPHTTSQQSYTRGSGFQALELLWSDVELAEEVSVTWTDREVGQSDELYDSENILVPAGETVTLWADFGAPLYAIDAITTTAGTPGGIDLSGSVAVTPTYYAQSAYLSIVNSGGVAANVRVIITGSTLATGESQTVSQTSAESFWTSREGRFRKVSGNRWVQSAGQANFLKAFMGDRQELPTLVAKLRGCPGNPSRRLGDRITVTDSELSLSATDFYITAISWAYGANRPYTQDIECVRCSDIFPLASSPGYFIIGSSTLGGTKVTFY